MYGFGVWARRSGGGEDVAIAGQTIERTSKQGKIGLLSHLTMEG